MQTSHTFSSQLRTLTQYNLMAKIVYPTDRICSSHVRRSANATEALKSLCLNKIKKGEDIL